MENKGGEMIEREKAEKLAMSQWTSDADSELDAKLIQGMS